MNPGQVAEGAGLAAWGSGFGFLLNRYRKRPDLRLRVAESRWRFDRRVAARRGLSQQEWFRRYSESERQLASRLGLPFTGVFVGLALVVLIRGLFT